VKHDELTQMIKWALATGVMRGEDVPENATELATTLSDYIHDAHPEWFSDLAAAPMQADLDRSHDILTAAGIPEPDTLCLSDRTMLLADTHRDLMKVGRDVVRASNCDHEDRLGCECPSWARSMSTLAGFAFRHDEEDEFDEDA